MSWRRAHGRSTLLRCSSAPFTDLQLLDGRSLARSPSPSLRRSVSSGYVGRCRSRPLPSPHCRRRRRRRRWDRSLTHSLPRCRFMRRECAMINPPPPQTRSIQLTPPRACVCSVCATTLSQTYPEALAVAAAVAAAAALDPLHARAIVAVTGKSVGGRTVCDWDGGCGVSQNSGSD